MGSVKLHADQVKHGAVDEPVEESRTHMEQEMEEAGRTTAWRQKVLPQTRRGTRNHRNTDQVKHEGGENIGCVCVCETPGKGARCKPVGPRVLHGGEHTWNTGAG